MAERSCFSVTPSTAVLFSTSSRMALRAEGRLTADSIRRPEVAVPGRSPEYQIRDEGDAYNGQPQAKCQFKTRGPGGTPEVREQLGGLGASCNEAIEGELTHNNGGPGLEVNGFREECDRSATAKNQDGDRQRQQRNTREQRTQAGRNESL